VTGYRPMTLADLAGRLARTAEVKVRWKLVWEFLEEYRWEAADVQPALLRDVPPLIGDERWDVLLGALAEHLAPGHDLAPPQWAEPRVAMALAYDAQRVTRDVDAVFVPRHQQALELARGVASAWDEAHALAGLGRCAIAVGQPADAGHLLRQAQEIFHRIGAADALTVLAELDALASTEPVS
jgi:hypothetical protein